MSFNNIVKKILNFFKKKKRQASFPMGKNTGENVY